MTDDKTDYNNTTPDEQSLMDGHMTKFSDMPVTLGEILGKAQTALLDAVVSRKPVVSHGDPHEGNFATGYAGMDIEVSGSMPYENFELSPEQQSLLDKFKALLPKRAQSNDGIIAFDANHVDAIDPEIVDRISGYDGPFSHGSDDHGYGRRLAEDYITELMRSNSAALDAVIIEITDGPCGSVDVDIYKLMATPLYSLEDLRRAEERANMYQEQMDESYQQFRDILVARSFGIDTLDPEPQVTRDQIAYFESCASTVPTTIDRAALDAGVPVARSSGLEAEVDITKLKNEMRAADDSFRDLGYGFSVILG